MDMLHTNEEFDSSEYNMFFNPNICHVCKERNKGILISCDQCDLISYCSEKHKKMHQEQHTYICIRIKKILEKIKSEGVLYQSSPGLAWIRSKKEFMQLLKASMTRELERYEVQMVEDRKSCFYCHEQADLFTCEICYSCNFCFDHAQQFHIHNSLCKDLALLLNINILIMKQPKKPFYSLYYIAFSHIKYINMIYTPDTASFFVKYVKQKDMAINTSATLGEYIYSDYISGPLTFYNARHITMLLLPLEGNVCIHIIAADSMDENGLPTWELLLHLFPDIKNLTIVLIGTELQSKTGNIDLCYRCKIYDQHFSYECYSSLYHNYVSTPNYKLPLVIMGFQVELENKERKTWTKSIIALRLQSCPLFLTATSQHKAQQDITTIKEVLGTAIKPVLVIENSYCGRRPYRDFRTDPVYYHNAVLVAYNNLIG